MTRRVAEVHRTELPSPAERGGVSCPPMHSPSTETAWPGRPTAPCGMPCARLVAERFQRRVQQLVDQPVERAADLLAGAVVQLRQLVQQPLQFVFLRLLPALAAAARSPGRWRGGSISAMKRVVSCSTIVHGGGQLLVAHRAVPLAGRLQVVDRIEIDVGPVADGRVEIARHGQVENQQRPLRTARLDPRERRQRDDRLRRARGADDQVGGGQRLRAAPPTAARGRCHRAGQLARPARSAG